MKKFKNMLLFIIVLLIIFTVDFLIYKNIDVLIPKQEKKLFTYDNNRERDNRYFLYELSKQIEQKNDYKRISSEELINIYDNKILYNLIINNIYKIEFGDSKYSEKIQNNIFVGNLTNTIYGDLKVISIRNLSYKGPNNLIVYSEDMKKIYYYDITQDVSDLYSNGYIEEKNIYDSRTSATIASEKSEQNRNEVLKKATDAFSSTIINTKFTPDTIAYKGTYYLLKDSTRDITVYYDYNNDVIFGLYKGFNK